MVEQQQRFENERQPLLPISTVAREINKRDHRRETQDPQQLDFLAPPQLDLFVELGVGR